MNPFSVLYSFCSFCLLVTYSLTITASTVSIPSTVIKNTTIHVIFMPVTTRLRVKLLTGHTYELSQTSSTGSSELLESSNFTTTTTSNIQHSNTSINSNFTLNGDPSIPHQTYLHDHSRPSLLEEHLEISKFQNSEFSNDIFLLVSPVIIHPFRILSPWRLIVKILGLLIILLPCLRIWWVFKIYLHRC